MFPDRVILPWLDRLRAELPDLELFDVHTHIGGNDPDGFTCAPEELLDALQRANARAVVFPMHEPGGYPSANDRVISEAKASGGRLVAFCRVNPEEDALAEVERCLEAGARGIKLHPRAEGFTLDHAGLRDVFALAHERRLPVLTHAGRGIPALGRHALELCERFPDMRMILAHAGICDLAWIWRAAGDHPNLLFDTAWWAPSDLLSLFALVPPGQILLGSDSPYATPVLAATMTLRYALQAGLSAEQAGGVAGGQLDRVLRAEELLDLGAAPGPGSLSTDPLLDRAHTFLISAIGQMLRGVEPDEALALAALACEVGDEAPQAPVCRSILTLLEERRRHRAETGRSDSAGAMDRRDGRPPGFASGIHLIVVAAGVARTPRVPLPAEPVPVDVAERSP